MAVAAGEAQATVTKRIPIGDGRALYVGTLAFGNKYVTGGDTIGTSEASRSKLPTVIDSMIVGYAKGYGVEWVETGGKLLLYVSPAAEKLAGVQVANGTDVSAITAAPFMAVGLA